MEKFWTDGRRKSVVFLAICKFYLMYVYISI